MKISFSQTSLPKMGSVLEVVELKYAFDFYVNSDRSVTDKFADGSIFPYINGQVVNSNFISDGILFIDLDHLNTIDGLSDRIFNSFEKICDNLPNCLACNYSFSKNLHFYFYDECVKNDSSLYSKRAGLYMYALSYAIKKLLGVDLSRIEGCLDAHNTNIKQRFFIHNLPYKYNDYVSQLSPDDIEKIEKRFGNNLLESNIGGSINRDLSKSDSTWNGEKSIDKNFSLDGYSGNEARCFIAGTSYIHFNKNRENAENWIITTFNRKNSIEILANLNSQIKGDYAEHFYNTKFEETFFPTTTEYVIELGEGYCSDHLGEVLDMLSNEKANLLIAGTGCGKTVFMKNLSELNGCYNVEPLNSIQDNKMKGMKAYNKSLHFSLSELDNNQKKTFSWPKLVGFFTQYEKMNEDDKSLVRSKVKYILIDESHMLFLTAPYRGQSGLQVLDCIRRYYKEFIFILLTATPGLEYKLCDLNVIKFHKEDKRDITIHPLNMGKVNMSNVVVNMVRENFLRDSNSIHYIYKDNITINEAKKYAGKLEKYDICATIYHSSLEIGKDHIEKKFELTNTSILSCPVLISSCAFGVGCDINNEVENVYIYIPCSENIDKYTLVQVIGRFRNQLYNGSPVKINVYLINPKKVSKKDVNEAERLLEAEAQMVFTQLRNLNSFEIRVNLMESYCMNFVNKERMLERIKGYVTKLGMKWDEKQYSKEQIKNLNKEIIITKNDSASELVKKYILNGRNIQLKEENKEFMKRKKNLDPIRFEILEQHIDKVSKMTSKNLKYFKTLYLMEQEDWRDVFEYIDVKFDDTDEGIQEAIQFGNKIKQIIFDAAIWKFVEDDDWNTEWNVYKKFDEKSISKTLWEWKQYVEASIKKNFLYTSKNEYAIDMYDIDGLVGLLDPAKMKSDGGKMGNTDKKSDGGKKGGKIGGKNGSPKKKSDGGKNGTPKKKCVITEKMKESRINLLKKYNLKIGQVFDSCEQLANHVNKSNFAIAEWRKKGWIN